MSTAITPDDFFAFGAEAGRRPQASSSPAQRPVLVFDTETTGISHRDVAIQIASSDGQKECMDYVKLPRGVYISHTAASVHGITNETLKRKAVDAEVALSRFFAACETVIGLKGLLVAHNVSFDRRLVEQTAAKHGVCLPAWWSDDSNFFCTMAASAPFSDLVTRGGRRKNFKNIELFTYFLDSRAAGDSSELNKPPKGIQLHDALYDVRVTLFNFREGERRGMW